MKRLRRCFCCGSCCHKKDNNQKVVPEKSPSIPRSISSKKNGETQETATYVNEAYRETEKTVPAAGDSQGLRKTPLQVDSLKQRNISDVSEVFKPPSPEPKSLSDDMMEKFDRKSKTLRSEDISDYDFGKMESGKESIDRDDASISEEGLPIQTTDEAADSADEEPPLQLDTVDGASPRKEKLEPPKSNKTTEWREKLKLDLDGDCDEEFQDELSDDDKSDDGKSLEVDFEDMDVDENDVSLQESVDERTRGSPEIEERPLSSASKTHNTPLVIDNGSYVVRGGWSGEFSPTSCVRNVVGSWRAEASEAWQEYLGSKFIGQTAIDRHSTLALDYPIQDGEIANWRGMQEVIEHVVGKELDADLTQHPVLITEPANVDKKQRERMTEIMIESLRAAGVCLKSQAAMCSLSADHPVGLVINSGYDTTEIVPVYSGYSLNFATTTLKIGGHHITDYLTRLAQRERGHTFTSVAEMQVINTIKERFGRVAITNAEVEQDKDHSCIEYALPDGRGIELSSELFKCAEPLFSPGLMGCASVGLPALVKQSLDRLDPGVMKESENTILLTGGNSNLSGLQARLESDINSSLNGFKICLKRTNCGDNAAWIGGSVFSQQPNFIDLCITEDLYFEYGAQLVHRLCF